MTAFALALVLTGWSVVRGREGLSRKAAGLVYLVLLVVTIVSWVGADVIVERFSAANWSEFNNRRGAWSDATGVFAAFPLTGTGLDTYGTATLFYQVHDLKQHYAQAHNDYLQLAAEGGLLLLIPISIGLLIFARDVRCRLKEDALASTAWWMRRGAVTALVAMSLQETVDFSLQMPGNGALFAIVCAIALHPAPVSRGEIRAEKSSRFRPTLASPRAATS